MFEELETVILTHDIEAYDLKEGAMGAIVHVHESGKTYEVEFVGTVSGRTIALLTLSSADIRSVASSEIFNIQGAVGSLGYSALGTADWKNPYGREHRIVGNATITVDTESSRIESGEERISYQTV